MKVLDFGKQAWKRPSDWIQTPSPNEDEIIMLYPVRATDNNFAVKVEGDYEVDWGDGTIETYDSGTQAEHSYDYNNLDAPLDNTGCKQVVIKIKPQEGNNITNFTLNLTLASGKQNNSILEFKGNLPYFGEANWSYNFYKQYTLKNALFFNIKKVSFWSSVFVATYIQNTNFPFSIVTGETSNLYSSLDLLNMNKITFDTSKYTRLSYPIVSNYSLKEVVFIGDNPECKVNNLQSASALRKITIKGKLYLKSPYALFYTDYLLSEIEGIENIDYSQSDGNFSGMFYGCSSLRKIVCDLSTATNLGNFIAYAYSLQELKLYNIPKINIDIKYSNVTREQFLDIFNALPDASGDDTSPILTITGCRGVADLTDDDKAIATDKNWTLVT